MKKFLALLLMVFVLVGMAAAQKVEAFPYVGGTLGVSGNLHQSNPDVSALAGADLRLLNGRFYSFQGIEIGRNDHFIYDGNLVLHRAATGLLLGVGVRTSDRDSAARPYAMIGRMGNEGWVSLKAIAPGADGWHDRWSLMGESNIEFVHRTTLYLRAGLSSYHPCPPLPGYSEVVFQSNGVTKYVYVPPQEASRKTGGEIAVGLKYWFR